MPQRWIYFFGNHHADGDGELKHVIGGKGASLADMTRAGLNVPPGFTISAECCDYFYRHDQRWPDDLEAELRGNLTRLELLAGRTFGVGNRPLLVAVRSGAAQSMPGMMDTLLNVGLTHDCIAAIAARMGNRREVWLAYLHFRLMYSRTVLGIEFTPEVEAFCNSVGKTGEDRLDAEQIRSLCMKLSERSAREFPTQSWDMLQRAINAVFLSWNSERALTYRKHHKIDGLLGTAVTVQMMCPSEVSGVMFTANPVNHAAEIIIESAFGLGEAIVLGKVTPDRFVLDKNDLAIKERVVSQKETRVATLAEDGQGQTGDAGDVSLRDEQVNELARLGRAVETHFKTPCDIEWALSRGQFYLLQARPIKLKSAGPTIDVRAREAVRQEEIAALRPLTEPSGTVWSRFNLAEILPEPTPMTWAIVRQFMSGRGGFGQMYRDIGFDPDSALDELGMFDLVCGRPYCNLSREPRMQYQNLPFEHNFELLKKYPQKALYPQATMNPRRAGLGFFIKIPLLFFKMWWAQAKQQQLIRSFAAQFTSEIVPPFLTAVEAAQREDWSKLSAKDVLERMHVWIQHTLFDFARESLKPTALAAIVLGNLERAFASRLQPPDIKPAEALAIGIQRAQAALRELMMGVHPDEHTDLPGAIRALRERRLSKDEFLRRFGHRGSQEMELARPRWAEDHAALDALLGDALLDSFSRGSENRADLPSAAKQGAGEDAWQNAWRKLADDARLLPSQRPAVEAELRKLQTYMGLRESAKHHLLRGYALIRRALVELDRRYQLHDGVFFLTPDDLIELVRSAEGKAPQMFFDRIEQRGRRREIVLSLPLPSVIYSDDLDAVGREMTHTASDSMQGVPLSAGIVEATAWVLTDVAGAQMPHEPYILVCPSTDPAWVPLFVQARGLVMETGGMLSHGAIVAREFGLPAVAGIADVHRRIKTGQRLRIDGATGTVQVVG